jgi:hypothetical protein
MAGEFIEFFNELLFGSGAWIGAIIIVSIIALTTLRTKLSGAIFMPICVFLGMEYFSKVPSNSNLMWIGILMYIMAIYCLAMLIMGVRRND